MAVLRPAGGVGGGRPLPCRPGLTKNTCMVALQIRDVPEDVRDALAEHARTRAQSLQEFLLSLVREEARPSVNISLLDRLAGRTDGSFLAVCEPTEDLAQERSDRDSQLVTGQDHAPAGSDCDADRAPWPRGDPICSERTRRP